MSKRDRHRKKAAAKGQTTTMQQVTGLIVAMELPTQATDVGDCVIVPLAQPQGTPPRQGRLVLTPAPNATGVVVVEPDVTFTAQHAITISCRAT
jgi:hypothetical protein